MFAVVAAEKPQVAHKPRRPELQKPTTSSAGGFGGGFGLPAQYGLAGGAHFIEAADAGGVRGSLHQFGLGGGLFGDRTHGVDEKIAFFLGLGFGGLDHHGAGNNQGKRGGVGVKAVIDEPLGDIHGVHAVLFLAIIAEDDFVHGRRSVGQVEYA